MAATGFSSFKAAVDGGNTGRLEVNPADQTYSSPIGKRDRVTLSSGANTITVPTGTSLICIVPPTDNTQTIQLKGVTGDTGVSLSKTRPSFVHWGVTAGNGTAGSDTFVLTAGGTISGVEISFI